MRKLSLFFTLLVLLIGGTMAAAAFLIPPEFYKQKIEEQASALLGRDLRIQGPVSLQFWPTIQARAQTVTLANPPGFSNPNFASMKVMRTSIAIMPLFSRRVEIREFILEEPQIVLEKRRDGAVNWAIGSASHASTRASANAGFVREPGALPLEASLGEIRLIGGDIKIVDHAKGNEHHFANVNLNLNMPALDAPMTAKGALTLNGQGYSLDAKLGGLRQFLEGEETPLSLNLQSILFNARFDGVFDNSRKIAATGTLTLTTPSVRKLAASAGTVLTQTPGTFGAFDVTGTASVNTKRLSFKEAKLSFDDINGTGSFGAVFAGARPKLTGNLDIDRLDLTPYLPPPASRGQGVPPWSTTSFNLDMLKVVDANFTLALGTLQAREIKIGKSAMKAALVNGRLQANLIEMELYGGQGTGKIVANSRGATPSFSLAADIARVEFQPLLIDAIKFKRLAGTGAVKFSLLGVGASQAEIMGDISGAGNLHLNDGQIIGINLASVLRSAQTYILSGALPLKANETQATDFTDLTASFTIADGMAKTGDFLMLAPVLRVPGKGTLDIGGQSVDFRLTPRAVASLKGQGGKSDLVGIKAPFRIHGPWNEIKAGLDTKLLKKKAKKKIKKEVGRLIDQNLGGDAGATLKSLFGVPDTPPEDPDAADEETPREKTDEELAMDALKSLFKKKKKKKTGDE